MSKIVSHASYALIDRLYDAVRNMNKNKFLMVMNEIFIHIYTMKFNNLTLIRKVTNRAEIQSVDLGQYLDSLVLAVFRLAPAQFSTDKGTRSNESARFVPGRFLLAGKEGYSRSVRWPMAA